jgi:hypothetical protein
MAAFDQLMLAVCQHYLVEQGGSSTGRTAAFDQ